MNDNLENDFKVWNSQSRQGSYDDEFDTTIYGPWMEHWEIVNQNKHTQSYEKNKSN